MLRRYPPPPPYPGWGPISAPTHPRPSRKRELLHQLVVPAVLFTIALFKGLLLTKGGLLAFALAVTLWFVLQNRPDRGRTVLEWVAVGLLLVLLSNAGMAAPNVKTVADRKAPAERVDAAKGDLDRARQGVINLWEQIAQGFPGPSPTPEPKPRKGHH
jgi:O-antigen ligase